MFSITLLSKLHAREVTALLDVAFGPGRFARTAYVIRGDAPPVPELSFGAFEEGRLVGSIEFTPIQVGENPLLLLGPLVVDPKRQGQGIGLALMEQGLEGAKRTDAVGTLLIGDAPYYERVGFVQMPAFRLKLPGPADPKRLLGLGHNGFEIGALEGSVQIASETP